mgnify:CR=1
MNLKTERQHAKLRKKAKRGFRGYPLATMAYYGPTDQRASKLVVAIVPEEDADPNPMEKWFSEAGDVRRDSDITVAVLKFLEDNDVQSVIAADGIIGCPHEEGMD